MGFVVNANMQKQMHLNQFMCIKQVYRSGPNSYILPKNYTKNKVYILAVLSI